VSLGELAVLRIVGDEIHAKGTCDRSLAEIAARAGVCRKLAQLTLRLAARRGV
jgi:ribosomal protein L40E